MAEDSLWSAQNWSRITQVTNITLVIRISWVKVGITFEWDVGVVAPLSLIILDLIFDSIGGARLESRGLESTWLFESTVEFFSPKRSLLTSMFVKAARNWTMCFWKMFWEIAD